MTGTCNRCESPCRGGLCNQCELELAHGTVDTDEPDWKIKQQSLDGGTPSGQTTLSGDIKPEGGDDE